MAGRPVKYTAEIISFISENKGKIPMRDIAAALGVKTDTLTKAAQLIRKKGIAIPKTRTQSKTLVKKKKEVTASVPKPKKIKIRSKLIDKKQSNGASQRHPKEDKPLIIKDFSNGIFVRKDSRTWVCKKPV